MKSTLTPFPNAVSVNLVASRTGPENPQGDGLAGMFRWIKNGKLVFTEMMTITVEGGVPVFNLRHHNRGLIPWEKAEDGALRYPLKSSTSGEIVFENPDRDEPRRFIFRSRLKVRV